MIDTNCTTYINIIDMRVFVTVVLLAVVALLAGDVSGGGVGSKCAGRRSEPCDSGLKVRLVKGKRCAINPNNNFHSAKNKI